MARRDSKMMRVHGDLLKLMEEEQKRIYRMTGIYPSNKEIQKKICKEIEQKKYGKKIDFRV